MKELSKSIIRRQRDPKFVSTYFKGKGIDIGGKPDPLSIYQNFFPLIESVKVWDLQDGDAQYMDGVQDETFDFVHSSHTLEHMQDPFVALKHWIRITKSGGFIVITIPDEDLYEQGDFVNKFNKYHNFTFTINKQLSWSDSSVNVTDLISALGDSVSVHKIELIDSGYRYEIPRFDQTRTPISESAIEFILRKRTKAEIDRGGRISSVAEWDEELKLHMNQYILDQRAAAEKYPSPFGETK